MNERFIRLPPYLDARSAADADAYERKLADATAPAIPPTSRAHNIVTTRTPLGWQAYDDDTYDGAPDSEWPHNCLGHGSTKQEAIDDLCSQLAQPYSLVDDPDRAYDLMRQEELDDMREAS